MKHTIIFNTSLFAASVFAVPVPDAGEALIGGLQSIWLRTDRAITFDIYANWQWASCRVKVDDTNTQNCEGVVDLTPEWSDADGDGMSELTIWAQSGTQRKGFNFSLQELTISDHDVQIANKD